MTEANDLRLEVFIRSMTHILGMPEVKRILSRVIPELESELVYNPKLLKSKKFSSRAETKIIL